NAPAGAPRADPRNAPAGAPSGTDLRNAPAGAPHRPTERGRAARLAAPSRDPRAQERGYTGRRVGRRRAEAVPPEFRVLPTTWGSSGAVVPPRGAKVVHPEFRVLPTVG